MRLLIVSHVPHYRHDGGYFAYGPYAKEIEIWAELFSEIVIAAPLSLGPPPSETCRINRPNVRVSRQREVGGTRWLDKVSVVLALPALVVGLSREMWNADAIHVRCPGNLGLLGALLAPLFCRKLVAKYAGQWNGFPGEEWTVRLQRWLLRSRWWRGPVTVYGRSVDEAPHVIEFFSTMFTADQLSRAKVSLAAKTWGSPPTVAFTGRLTRAKNADVLIKAVAELKSEGIHLQTFIVGDGPERERLKSLANSLNVQDLVVFTGGIVPERVPEYLERSDIFVLASETEGWPKSIAEAMAFGLICIGSDRGLIPKFLAEGRGLTVRPKDVSGLVDTLRRVATSPADYKEMRRRASQWAQVYSIEHLRDALQALLLEWWRPADVRVSQHDRSHLL
jgi:glycosyltransferase involved in cell wall biosynthesis